MRGFFGERRGNFDGFRRKHRLSNLRGNLLRLERHDGLRDFLRRRHNFFCYGSNFFGSFSFCFRRDYLGGLLSLQHPFGGRFQTFFGFEQQGLFGALAYCQAL